MDQPIESQITFDESALDVTRANTGVPVMSKPPLWEVMQIAYFRSGAPTPACRYSNQIRAIAEWIEQRQAEDYAVTLPDVREIIGWLTTEADRADAEPGEP